MESPKKESCITYYIPEDITILILIRLSVKSILRFRSVCRSWNSIINSDSFISDRLHRQKSKRSRRFLFYKDETQRFSLVSYQIHNRFYSYPNPIPRNTFIRIHGSSNRIICFSFGPKELLVCNPATKQLLQIPLPPHTPTNDTPFDLRSSFLAFGFYPGLDGYRLVSFVPCGKDGEAEAMIYSSRQKSWRMFGGAVPHGIVMHAHNLTVINGTIIYGCRRHVFQDHELGVCRETNTLWSFHIGIERFQDDIKFPNDISHPFDLRVHTAVLTESLSLYRFANNVLEVWVADFGKPEIWVQTYRFGINHDCLRRPTFCYRHTSELCLTNNPLGWLILCDLETRKWQYYDTEPRRLEYYRFLGPYVENIFPLSQ